MAHRIAAASPDQGTDIAKLDQGFEVESGDGAIGIKDGVAIITKGSAAALTLVAPAAGLPNAGGDDGRKLKVVSTTAFAHVVTCPANKINGNKLSATLAAAAGSAFELVAYNGVWYLAENEGTVTLA